MALRSLSQVAAPNTVYGTSLVITSSSTKHSIWHFARYHKWQHQTQYMALRSLSQAAAPKKEFYIYWSCRFHFLTRFPSCYIALSVGAASLQFYLFLVNQIFHDKVMTLRNIKLQKRQHETVTPVEDLPWYLKYYQVAGLRNELWDAVSITCRVLCNLVFKEFPFTKTFIIL